MAVTNDAPAPVRQFQIGMRRQKHREFRLHRLFNQPLRAGAQDCGERVVDFVFLPKGDNIIGRWSSRIS
jgi:hypothetical protein